MSEPITAARLRKASMEIIVHIDGADFYRNVFRCIEYPRLTIATSGPRRKGKSEHSKAYFVDGVEIIGGLEAVAAALNEPPKGGTKDGPAPAR